MGTGPKPALAHACNSRTKGGEETRSGVFFHGALWHIGPACLGCLKKPRRGIREKRRRRRRGGREEREEERGGVGGGATVAMVAWAISQQPHFKQC